VAQPAVGGLDPPPEGPEHAAFWSRFPGNQPTAVSGGSTSAPTVVQAPGQVKRRGRAKGRAKGRMKSGVASRAKRRRR